MDLESNIRQLSAEVVRTSTDQDLREAATRTGGLPVYADMGGVLIIAIDGSVLHFDPENQTIRAVTTPWAQLALTKAAKRHASLATLMPSRPDGAQTCGACNGTGTIDGVDCGTCFSTGWIVSP